MASQSHLDDPAYWRKRAAETRQLAGQVSQLDHKKELIAMAERYERLAERAEGRSKGTPQPMR